MKSHKRTEGIAQEEIFEDWDLRYLEVCSVGSIIDREPLMMPLEYNPLYQRRLHAFRMPAVTV